MSWVAVGVAAVGVVGSVGGSLLANSQNKGTATGGGQLPNYKPVAPTPFNPQQTGQSLNALYPYLQQNAAAATAYQTAQREKIMPGSKNQFALASQDLQSFLGGRVPLDQQNLINRQVAERTQGGFNAFSGGGQAPSDYARNLGLTSLNLTQAGLSAAPTWLQLANSFVIQPFRDVAPTALGIGQQQYQYDALNQNTALQNATSQYQSQANNAQLGLVQQQLGNANNQQLLNTGLGAVQGAASIYGNYLNSQYGAKNANPIQEAPIGGTPVYRPGSYQLPGGNWQRTTGIGSPYNTGA